jgi:serine/threonine protein kinase
LTNQVGSDPYMAPEVREGLYDGFQADLFSLGVILFTMYTGCPPFTCAKSTDPLYSLLTKPDVNDRRMFWAFHKKRKPSLNIPDDFKDLIGKMLALKFNDRLSINAIK